MNESISQPINHPNNWSSNIIKHGEKDRENNRLHKGIQRAKLGKGKTASGRRIRYTNSFIPHNSARGFAEFSLHSIFWPMKYSLLCLLHQENDHHTLCHRTRVNKGKASFESQQNTQALYSGSDVLVTQRKSTSHPPDEISNVSNG